MNTGAFIKGGAFMNTGAFMRGGNIYKCLGLETKKELAKT